MFPGNKRSYAVFDAIFFARPLKSCRRTNLLENLACSIMHYSLAMMDDECGAVNFSLASISIANRFSKLKSHTVSSYNIPY